MKEEQKVPGPGKYNVVKSIEEIEKDLKVSQQKKIT